jgi:beta-glucosidase
MILLKNDGLLPLKRGSNIAVVGPMGVDRNLISDYAGDGGEGGCWPKGDQSCIHTIFEAIEMKNTGGTTHSAAGVPAAHDHSPPAKFLAEALAVAKVADIVVLAIGNDRDAEHEGIDRHDVNLPTKEETLAKLVIALKKPTLMILSNGGAVSIDGLIEPSKAIVECFNPSHNAPQLAALLFGEANNWGKLPVTIYSHDYTTGAGSLPAQPMDNYDMVKSPGRTCAPTQNSCLSLPFDALHTRSVASV